MTNKQRKETYESFLHKVALVAQVHNQVKIIEAIDIIQRWSYAHRVGNGEYSDYEQQKIVDNVIEKMRAFLQS